MKAQSFISGTFTAITLTVSSFMVSPLPANASWFSPLPLPSGIYANVQGKEFFLGDFVTQPNPECPTTCSWAVRYNGNLSAHGNGRTPAWVIQLIRNWRR